MESRSLFTILVGVLSLCYTLGCDKPSASSSGGEPATEESEGVPWSQSEVVTSEAIAKGLGDTANAPIVVHVGPEVLFKRGHVPGAKYGGMAGDDQGLAKLEAYAKTLPKDRDVVIYCGCCPKSDCPNIRPAYTKLKAMGLRVKVLDMPKNFHTDWENKGYPVEK